MTADQINARLDKYLTLPEDWDSYGALPPSPVAIAAMRTILTDPQTCKPTHVSPCSDGGISAEWALPPGIYLELVVCPSGAVEFFVSDEHAQAVNVYLSAPNLGKAQL